MSQQLFVSFVSFTAFQECGFVIWLHCRSVPRTEPMDGTTNILSLSANDDNPKLLRLTLMKNTKFRPIPNSSQKERVYHVMSLCTRVPVG